MINADKMLKYLNESIEAVFPIALFQSTAKGALMAFESAKEITITLIQHEERKANMNRNRKDLLAEALGIAIDNYDYDGDYATADRLRAVVKELEGK